MKKYKCGVCGYIYDEAVGQPDQGIAPGTRWDDVPDDFKCPLCGAPKALFEENKAQETPEVEEEGKKVVIEKTGDLSPEIISVIFSNLAKGCEKQRLLEEMDLFNELSGFFKSNAVKPETSSMDEACKLLEEDLSSRFPAANAVAKRVGDRGSLRALTWSEKVSRIDLSLTERFKENKGSFEDNDVYVCEICGFVYSGKNLPDNCPICKVPNFKISKMERR